MRWQGRRQSENVEDQRGRSPMAAAACSAAEGFAWEGSASAEP